MRLGGRLKQTPTAFRSPGLHPVRPGLRTAAHRNLRTDVCVLFAAEPAGEFWRTTLLQRSLIELPTRTFSLYGWPDNAALCSNIGRAPSPIELLYSLNHFQHPPNLLLFRCYMRACYDWKAQNIRHWVMLAEGRPGIARHWNR